MVVRRYVPSHKQPHVPPCTQAPCAAPSAVLLVSVGLGISPFSFANSERCAVFKEFESRGVSARQLCKAQLRRPDCQSPRKPEHHEPADLLLDLVDACLKLSPDERPSMQQVRSAHKQTERTKLSSILKRPIAARLISSPFPPGCRLPNISRPVLQAAAGTQPRRRQPSSPLLPAATATVSLHSAAWAPTTLARRHPRDRSSPRLGAATATAGLHIAALTTVTTRFRSPMLSCRRGLAAWAPLGSPWHRGAASGRGRITWGRFENVFVPKTVLCVYSCTVLSYFLSKVVY